MLNSLRLPIIAGPHLDVETIYSLKQCFSSFGILNSYSSQADYSCYYFSSVRVKDIEVHSSFLSINSYLRNEVPLLNSRIRKSNNFYMSDFKFFGVGVGSNFFTYPVKLISNNTHKLSKILNGKSYVSKSLISAKYNLVVFHKFDSVNHFNNVFSFLFKPFFIKIDNCVSYLISSHMGLNLEKFNSSLSSFYSIGFNNDIDYSPFVYQGHHGNSYTSNSCVIIPSTVFSEKTSNFLNLEGILQKAHAATSPELLVKKDEEIFKALTELNSVLVLNQSFLNFKKLYSFVNLEFSFSFALPY